MVQKVNSHTSPCLGVSLRELARRTWIRAWAAVLPDVAPPASGWWCAPSTPFLQRRMKRLRFAAINRVWKTSCLLRNIFQHYTDSDGLILVCRKNHSRTLSRAAFSCPRKFFVFGHHYGIPRIATAYPLHLIRTRIWTVLSNFTGGYSFFRFSYSGLDEFFHFYLVPIAYCVFFMLFF